MDDAKREALNSLEFILFFAAFLYFSSQSFFLGSMAMCLFAVALGFVHDTERAKRNG